MWMQNPYNSSVEVCGSSSGPAISVAANMVSVTLGTETDGSIICPASFNSVVGIKPTVGLTSRAGVIPISPRQDTVGYVINVHTAFSLCQTNCSANTFVVVKCSWPWLLLCVLEQADL